MENETDDINGGGIEEVEEKKQCKYIPSQRNQELISEYLRYRSKNSSASQKSMMTLSNMYTMRSGCVSYFEEYHNANLDQIKAKMVIEYAMHMSSTDILISTIKIRLSALTGIIGWMFNQKLVEDDALPRKIPLNFSGVDKKKPIMVPTIEEIFKVRNRLNSYSTTARLGLAKGKSRSGTASSNVLLRTIAMIEILLSSGIRAGELLQLREGDILTELSATDTPYDVEEQRPSRYVGGLIRLTTRKHKLKTGRSRTTYISMLACRALKAYAERAGIVGTGLPLFPIDYETINTGLSYMLKGVITGYNSSDGVVQVDDEPGEPERRAGFRDFSFEDMDISEDFKRLLRKRSDSADQIDSIILGEDGGEIKCATSKPKLFKRSFHPHSMRHFCASLQYFRGWNGSHGDTMFVKGLLGHSTIEMLEKYIHVHKVVENKRQWLSIVLGRTREYGNIIPG